MRSDSSVVADAAAGAAFVAGTRIAMSAASAAGAFRFGGAQGSVLRPLSFGERTELVSSASTTDAVAAGILNAATLEGGDGGTALLEVLAMWLAGAEFDAPGFLETTLLVARVAGWQPQDLFAAPAREIDRMAVQLGEQSDWKSLVFAEAVAETVESVRERFAKRLLRRSGGAEGGRVARSDGPVAAVLTQDERGGGRASARPPVSVPAAEEGQAEGRPAFGAVAEANRREAMPLVRGVRVLVPHAQGVGGETRKAMAAGEQSRQVVAAPAFAIRERGASATPVASASTVAVTQAAPVWSAAAALPLSHAWQEREDADERDVPWDESAVEQSRGLRAVATAGGRRDAARAAGGDAGGPVGDVGWDAHGANRRRDAAEPAGEAAGGPLAAMLAALLDDEADLRGVER